MSYGTGFIGLTAAVHGTRLHKTSRRDEMVRDPRRDRDASTSRGRLETETTSLLKSVQSS